MIVELINHSHINPDTLCGMAASLCYNGNNPVHSLNHAIKTHHDSVTEHSSFTFKISGVSSALLAQLTRHRFFSFSVQSERYCGASPEYVTPPSIERNPEALEIWEATIEMIHEAYDCLVNVHKIPKEDARMIREKATTYNLIATANSRELMHFFELRCCSRAQWEINHLARNMLACVKVVAPITFQNAGAHCERFGFCPEGSKCCGRAMPYEEATEIYTAYNAYIDNNFDDVKSVFDFLVASYEQRSRDAHD